VPTTVRHWQQPGKDGEAKWLKATVYTIIALMVVTLPVWYRIYSLPFQEEALAVRRLLTQSFRRTARAGPAYVVYKMKQRKKKRQLSLGSNDSS